MLTRGIVITSKNLITLTTFHAHHSNFITFKGPAKMALFQNIRRIFMKYRDTFKAMSNIYDEAFCQKSQRFNLNLSRQNFVKYPMKKIFITPEPVMILTLNLELYLNLRKEVP